METATQDWLAAEYTEEMSEYLVSEVISFKQWLADNGWVKSLPDNVYIRIS